MVKKTLLKAVVYSIVFLLLHLSEKAIGIRGFGLGFLFALLYCRENMLLTLPLYCISALILGFSVPYLICIGISAVIVVLVSLVHYKLKKKFSVAEVCLLAIISFAPYFVFYSADMQGLVGTLIGVGIAVVFCYISIAFLYPVLIRGLKYRISSKETAAFCIVIAALSCGLNTLQPFKISVYFAVFTFAVLFFKGLDPSKVLLLSLSMAVGAFFPSGDVGLFTLSALLGLSAVGLYAVNKYISAFALPLIYAIAHYLLASELQLLAFLPPLLGGLISLLVPKRFYKLANSYRQSYQERFALRTVVNRDRESVAWRLNNVARAFAEMKSILSTETGEGINPGRIVDEVCAQVCDNCRQREACRAKMGSAYGSIAKLVNSAVENGKATILDANVNLGDNCISLPRLIAATNERAARFRTAVFRREGMEQGRDMLITQMGGVSELIVKLAESVNMGFSYDTKLETKLIDELSYRNIVASDAVVYGRGKNTEEVSLIVREKDAARECIAETVSMIMKRKMEVAKISCDVNGMAGIILNPAPRYKAVFGEFVVGVQNRCGDTRQAVKISRDKIMFVLSDGMGSGQNAYETANNIIMLIENFYKAGFDHNIILSTVSKFLALRAKEDFSALDIAIIDTQNAHIDFIKQGGRESYLYDGSNVEIVEGGALPIGIVEDAEPQIETRILKPEQILIMASDGVAEHLTRENMAELLNGSGTYNPQKIAEQIVDNALRISGHAADDMTCMVIKLAVSAA